MKECVVNFQVSMFGMRSAARNWQKCYTDLSCHCGFRVTRGNTYMFGHQQRDIVVVVHGHGFVSTADIEDLRCLESMLEETFDHDRHHRARGREREANHSEKIVKEFDLQGAKTLSSPVSDTNHKSK